MTTYSIPIVDDSYKINSAFTKANGSLLTYHADKFLECLDKKQLLKELWLTEYRASITDTSIVFNRELDMTMFLLRWS
jgi:hypothetical protein